MNEKKDEFIQSVIKNDLPKFLKEQFPKNNYITDRAESYVTRFLIWLRDEHAE